MRVRTLLKMDYCSPKHVELLNVMNKINHPILCILLDYIYVYIHIYIYMGQGVLLKRCSVSERYMVKIYRSSETEHFSL